MGSSAASRLVYGNGFNVAMTGGVVESCPFRDGSKEWKAWRHGWHNAQLVVVRGAVRDAVIRKRGGLCDLFDWCARSWECGRIGSELHEVFVPRAAVRGPKKQLEVGLFCEENCVLLCEACHDMAHEHVAAARAFLLEKQRRRGFDLDDSGLWPAIIPLLKVAPGVILASPGADTG